MKSRSLVLCRFSLLVALGATTAIARAQPPDPAPPREPATELPRPPEPTPLTILTNDLNRRFVPGEDYNSSPENTVRGFVQFLNYGDFNSVATNVFGGGAQGHRRFDDIREQFQPPKVTFNLVPGDFVTIPDSDPVDIPTVIVTFALTDLAPLHHEAGKPFPITVERLRLRLDEGNWQIMVAPAPADISLKVPPEDTIAYYASLMVDPGTLAKRNHYEAGNICEGRLKQLSLAAMQFAADNDGMLKFNATDFKNVLMPYARSEKTFRCPLDDGKQDSFSFNNNLCDATFLKIPNAAQVVMFYEGHDGKLDYRHEGRANVCFADGHMARVDENAAKNLRWTAGNDAPPQNP